MQKHCANAKILKEMAVSLEENRRTSYEILVKRSKNSKGIWKTFLLYLNKTNLDQNLCAK